MLLARESMGVSAALVLSEDGRVDGRYGPRVVSQVLGHFVYGGAESQPGRSGKVAQIVRSNPSGNVRTTPTAS